MNRMTKVLGSLNSELLTEDVKQQIVEAFEETVTEKAQELSNIEVQNALQQLDEQHTAQLEQLLEAVDKDHVSKLHAVLGKVDEDRTQKLKNVINHYEKMLKEDAKQFREEMVDEISQFLDFTLEKNIPTEQVNEAVSSMKARRMVEGIRKIVAIDDDFVTENIREALVDGKDQIDSLRKELNEAVKENIKLNQNLKGSSAELVLEKKTADMTPEKKKYVLRVLGDKSPEYITENFDYVVKMHDRDVSEEKELITEKAKTKTVLKHKTNRVDTPKLVTEDVDSSSNPYVDELQKFDK